MRTVNLTNINFTTEQQKLLDQGKQYCIPRPTETQWTILILETEQAIKLLDPNIQDAYRFMTAKKLTQIRNTHNKNNNKTHKRQLYIAKNIHNKLSKNKAIITQADKGKTTVIIYEHEYHKKIRAFLSENNIEPIPTDPTNKYQTHLTRKLKNCKLIFLKKQHTHNTKEHRPTYIESTTKTPETKYSHQTCSKQ